MFAWGGRCGRAGTIRSGFFSAWTLMKGCPLGIRTESEEPVLLCKPVRPVLLGNLLAGAVLTAPRGHRFELGHRGPALSRVLRAVLPDQIPDDVRTLEHDAAARGAGRGLAEVAK